jgi:hypothetical protein
VIPISDPWGYNRADSCNAVVFIAMNDSKLHELTLCPGQGWQSWTLPSVNSVSGISGRPSGYVRADGVSAVVYRDLSSVIHELKLQNGSWTDGTLSTPSVASISQVFGHPAPGSRSSVLFQGTRLRVWHRYELSQPVGGQWGLQEF